MKVPIESFTQFDLARFNRKVGPLEANGCRLWAGSLDTWGYGYFKIAGRNLPAHQIALYLAGRPQPDPSKQVDHICKVTWCVEASHLRWVTVSQNNSNRDYKNKWSDSATCSKGHRWDAQRPIETTHGIRCRVCFNWGERRRWNKTFKGIDIGDVPSV